MRPRIVVAPAKSAPRLGMNNVTSFGLSGPLRQTVMPCQSVKNAHDAIESERPRCFIARVAQTEVPTGGGAELIARAD